MYKLPPVYKYPIQPPRFAQNCGTSTAPEHLYVTYETLSFVRSYENEDGALYKCLGCAETGIPWYTSLCRDEEQMHYETRKHAELHQRIVEWGAMKWKR